MERYNAAGAFEAPVFGREANNQNDDVVSASENFFYDSYLSRGPSMGRGNSTAPENFAGSTRNGYDSSVSCDSSGRYCQKREVSENQYRPQAYGNSAVHSYRPYLEPPLEDRLNPDVLRLTPTQFAEAYAKGEMTTPKNLVVRLQHMGNTTEAIPFLRQVQNELRLRNSHVILSWRLGYDFGNTYGSVQPLEINVGGSKGRHGIAMVKLLPYN